MALKRQESKSVYSYKKTVDSYTVNGTKPSIQNNSIIASIAEHAIDANYTERKTSIGQVALGPECKKRAIPKRGVSSTMGPSTADSLQEKDSKKAFFKVQGYHENNDYTNAKKPAVKWQNEKHLFGSLDHPELQAWKKKGGWVGWSIPKDVVVYDVDDRELGEATLNALNQTELSFHCIQTPNGFQFIFKNNGEGQHVKALNNLGFLYDTRVTGKGYIVYPTANTEGRVWEKKSEKPLDEAPFWLQCRIDKKKIALKKAETIGLPFLKGERDDSFTRYVGSIGYIQNLSMEQKNQMIEIVANWFCTPVFEEYRKFFNHQYLQSDGQETNTVSLEDANRLLDAALDQARVENTTNPVYKDEKVLEALAVISKDTAEWAALKHQVQQIYVGGNRLFSMKEFQKIVEEFKNKSTETPYRSEKGRFLHLLFAQMLVSTHHVKRMGDTPFYYDADRGIYSSEDFIGLCLNYLPNMLEKEYKQVLFTLKGIAPKMVKTDTGYIPLSNGLLNLNTLEVEAFTPDKFFTSRLEVNYDSAAYNVYVDTHLNEVFRGDAGMRELFECMLGDVINQDNTLLVKTFILKGPKGTGKSTTVRMIQNFLGTENYSNHKLQDLDKDIYIPDLQGKQANLDPDMATDYIKEPSNFKKITGGDEIMGCRKYENPIRFRPYCTLIVGVNGMPKYKDEGGAMKDRFIIIPFERRFDRSKGAGSFDERDLCTEDAKSYILNLAIHRLVEMYKRKAAGELLLPEVAEVEKAIHDNAIEQCTSLQFAEDEGGLEKIVGKTVDEMYEAFVTWLAREGSIIRKTRTNFKRDICEHYDLEAKKVYNSKLKNTYMTFVKPGALRVAK